VPVQELTQPGQLGTVYVSVAGRPELVRVVDPDQGGGSLNFSSYDQPVQVTAPPASETIDGSKAGI